MFSTYPNVWFQGHGKCSQGQSGSGQKGSTLTFQYFFTFPFFDAFHRNGESASLFYILSQFLFIDLNSPTANIKGDARDKWNSR